MTNLKDYRVSLKFSEKDPDQADVVRLLKQLGRKKSSFITRAIKYYLDNNPSPEIPGNNSVLTSLITENMVKATIIKMLQSGELSYNFQNGRPVSEVLGNMEASEDDYVETPPAKPVQRVAQRVKQPAQETATPAPVPEPAQEVESAPNSEDVDSMLSMLDDF